MMCLRTVVSFGLNDLVIAMRSKTPLPTILEPTFAELMNQTSRLYKSGGMCPRAVLALPSLHR